MQIAIQDNTLKTLVNAAIDSNCINHFSIYGYSIKNKWVTFSSNNNYYVMTQL